MSRLQLVFIVCSWSSSSAAGLQLVRSAKSRWEEALMPAGAMRAGLQHRRACSWSTTQFDSAVAHAAGQQLVRAFLDGSGGPAAGWQWQRCAIAVGT